MKKVLEMCCYGGSHQARGCSWNVEKKPWSSTSKQVLGNSETYKGTIKEQQQNATKVEERVMNRNNSITERQKGKGHIACACQTYKTNNSTGKNHRKHISSKKTMIWSI